MSHTVRLPARLSLQPNTKHSTPLSMTSKRSTARCIYPWCQMGLSCCSMLKLNRAALSEHDGFSPRFRRCRCLPPTSPQMTEALFASAVLSTEHSSEHAFYYSDRRGKCCFLRSELAKLHSAADVFRRILGERSEAIGKRGRLATSQPRSSERGMACWQCGDRRSCLY